jgi:peptide/nickel transport system substrate-binding protein
VSGLVVAIFFIQLVGVGVPTTRNAVAAGPVELRVGFLEAMDSLNPFRGLFDPSFEFYGLVYDFLFSLDQDANLIPNLAVSANADAIGQNWTYQIRQGVNWSDGTPFTADDVAFTINYNIQDFTTLWNYEPYVNRIVQCASYPPSPGDNCGAIVDPASPWNVTVYFDRPFVPGKAIFIPIIQKAQWENIPLEDAASKEINCPPYPDAKPPIGTGPFIADANICTQFSGHQPILVHKNPNYHPVGNHAGPAKVDNVYMIQFLDESQMVYALQRGAIDLAKYTSSGYDALAGTSNVARQQGLICTQYWNEIAISQYDNESLNPARYDQNVRRAMAKATNKDYILQTIYDGRGVRGTSIMSPVTPEWWYDPTTDGENLTFDIAAANALLDAAGYDARWTDGTGTQYRMASRDITFNDTNGNLRTVPQGQHLEFTMDIRAEFLQEKATANYLTSEWARIGIKLDVFVKLESAQTADMYNGAVDTYIDYWSGDPDPNYLLSIQSGYTLDGWNDNFWNNESYNELYVKQLADYNLTQRQIDVRAAQRLNYQSAVYIIYIYPFGEWAWRTDRYTGWGDWVTHPYRQMDNFWGANPLFLELTPVGAFTNNCPTTPTIQPAGPISTFVNTTQRFAGTVYDPDQGQNLTWLWNWGSGETDPSQSTTATTQNMAVHSWDLNGTYNVSLTVSDGLCTKSSAIIEVDVGEIPLEGLGWINGTVTDAATGLPIAGAAVSTTPGSYRQSTDSAGNYGIGVPTGSYTVTAGEELYLSKSQSNVQGVANQTVVSDFALTPNYGWIAGTVTSASGSAIKGSAIYIDGNGKTVAVSTNDQGRYNKSLAPGAYAVDASATGYIGANKTGQVVTVGATTVVDFQLSPVVPPESGLSLLAYVGIAVVVIIAVAAIAVYMIMRRRKKEEAEAKIELPKK